MGKSKNPVTQAKRKAKRAARAARREVVQNAPVYYKKVKTAMKKAGPVVEDIGDVTQDIGAGVGKAGAAMAVVGEGMAFAAPAVAATGFEPLAAAMVAGSAGLIAGGEILGTAGTVSVALGKGISETGSLMHHYGQGVTLKEVKPEHHVHYDVAHTAYKEDEEKTLPGFTLDADLSTDRKVDVWKKNDSKDVYIGYQGSQFEANQRGVQDTVADWHILRDTTEESKMFQHVDEITQQVFDKYGANHKIHSGSHSLGGSLAHKMGCKYKFDTVVTFNAGSTPWTKGCKEEPTAGIVNYTTGSDFVSVSNLIPYRTRKERTYVIKTQNASSAYDVVGHHDVTNFKPTTRMSNSGWA